MKVTGVGGVEGETDSEGDRSVSEGEIHGEGDRSGWR